MTSLEDAWKWYQSARRTFDAMSRLAEYWNELPWDGDIGRDNRLRTLEATSVSSDAATAKNPLGDLAVVVLFSVFESEIRDRILTVVEPELFYLKHAVAVKAANELRDRICEGSFYHLIGALKLEGDKGLIEEVNQVRRYRNWVAHGRRGEEPDQVSPDAAFSRLRRFLAMMGLRPEKAEPG